MLPISWRRCPYFSPNFRYYYFTENSSIQAVVPWISSTLDWGWQPQHTGLRSQSTPITVSQEEVKNGFPPKFARIATKPPPTPSFRAVSMFSSIYIYYTYQSPSYAISSFRRRKKPVCCLSLCTESCQSIAFPQPPNPNRQQCPCCRHRSISLPSQTLPPQRYLLEQLLRLDRKSVV